MHTSDFTPAAFPADITKEELSQLPRAAFRGRLILVDTLHKAQQAVKALSQQQTIGIDTESKPNFIPGKRTSVSLLQLSTEETCYLFRLHLIGITAELKKLLEDPNQLKIGLSLRDDITGLRRIEAFTPGGFVELQQLAPAYGLRCASLQKMYGIVCGQYMSKAQRMTNWEAPTLSEAQQAYAALDAQASLEIYHRFMALPKPAPTQFGLIYL